MRAPALLRSPLPVALMCVTVVGSGAGCDNRIGGGRVLEVDTTPRSDAGVFKPTFDAEVPPELDGGEPPPPPVDGGVERNTFTFAAVGSQCVNDAQRPYVILSSEALDCAGFADVLKNGPSGDLQVAYAPLDDLTALGARQVSAQVCLTGAACQARTLQLNVSQIGQGQSLVARYFFEGDGVRDQGDVTAQWCDFDAGAGGGGALASGLTMSEVAIYQGVKISLMQDGTPQTLNAPVIGGRPALIRVFVRPDANFTPRDIVARLHIEAPGQAPVDLEETVRVSISSSEQNPNTTFNFRIPAAAFALNAGFNVGLYETQGCGGATGSTTGVLYPASGVALLDPQPTGGALKIVLVPVRYNADGSGRLPDVSAGQVSLYRDTMYKLYPVPEVSVTVREPFDWEGGIGANGSGWSAILQALLDLRNSDNPDPNTYYYGIFAPASTFRNYCSGGCVTGLGPVPRATDTYSRGAVGVGFSGSSSPETFVHEIGHAMGRSHAPCQTSNADPAYPYSGGRLGVWGYDLLTSTLIDPNENRDMMGYCDPAWISDYNYEAIFQRIYTVNGARPFTSWAPSRWKVLMDDMDGVRWGNAVVLNEPPRGEPLTVRYLGPQGELMHQDTAHAYTYDHLEGRYLLLPAPPEGAALVEVPGAGQIAL